MTGWKDWQIGEVVTESDFQNLVQDQVVQRYADASARTSALGTAVAEGMVSYLEDTNKVEVYDGSSWVQVGQEGDITSVTAGTGLTGGGTAGDVTLSADYAAIGSAVSITASQVTDLTASAAAINTIDDGTAGYTALSNGTAGITYQPVSHNYIINGAFDVWQRGTAVTVSSNPDSGTNNYIADRFIGGLVDDGVAWLSFTASRSTDTISGLDYSCKITSNDATANAFVFAQKIEDESFYVGKTFTFSFYIKRIATFSGTHSLKVDGTTLTSDINSLSSSEFTRLTVTKQFSTNKLFITIGDRIAGSPVLTSSTGDLFLITGVQLEAGSVATPFKRHAPSLQGELAACQRYFERQTIPNFNRLTVGQAVSTTVVHAVLDYSEKRSTPSISSTGTYLVTNAAGSTLTGTSILFDNIRTTQSRLGIGVAIGLVAGNASIVNGGSTAFTIDISSEL